MDGLEALWLDKKMLLWKTCIENLNWSQSSLGENDIIFPWSLEKVKLCCVIAGSLAVPLTCPDDFLWNESFKNGFKAKNIILIILAIPNILGGYLFFLYLKVQANTSRKMAVMEIFTSEVKSLEHFLQINNFSYFFSTSCQFLHLWEKKRLPGCVFPGSQG